MLQNESFTKNYNLTRKDSEILIEILELIIMNSFMCKQTQKKILIKDEKKENIAICAYFCI